MQKARTKMIISTLKNHNKHQSTSYSHASLKQYQKIHNKNNHAHNTYDTLWTYNFFQPNQVSYFNKKAFNYIKLVVGKK